MKKIINILIASVTVIILFSCSDKTSNPVSNKVQVRIAVLSDPHIFDKSLGIPSDTSGYLLFSPKLMLESEAIMESAVNGIIAENVDLLIVSGDLTNNGEKVSHEKFASFLELLENTGIKVFVIPGNHDVLNPGSYNFSGGSPVPEPSVTPEEFEQIYSKYGYSEALYKDPNSLSYVAEPVNGLWIIGMDDCRYKENAGRENHIVGGRFSDETVNWIKQKIREGKKQNKIIIGMNHHGILEHFTGQKTYPVTSDYVIDDWQMISDEFANAGLKLVFTGHFHANDIVKKQIGDNFIFDIETGSVNSYPCQYRILSLTEDNKLNISTKYIVNVNYDTGGLTFRDYAKKRMETSANEAANYILIELLKYSEQEASKIAPVLIETIIAYYKGDEEITPEAQELLETLGNNHDANSIILTAMLNSLLIDLPPADNNITIDLKTGEAAE